LPTAYYGPFTLSDPVDDEREIDASKGHDVQFVESGKNATEAFEMTKQTFHFVSALVHFAVVFPRSKTVASGWNNGNETQVERELSGLVAFIRPVHEQVKWPIGAPKVLQQGTPFGRIIRVARGECKGYGCSSIRGNHMNPGGPSTSGFSDCLRSVFFNAPVPSG
jgi:hypothetical protein